MLCSWNSNSEPAEQHTATMMRALESWAHKTKLKFHARQNSSVRTPALYSLHTICIDERTHCVSDVASYAPLWSALALSVSLFQSAATVVALPSPASMVKWSLSIVAVSSVDAIHPSMHLVQFVHLIVSRLALVRWLKLIVSVYAVQWVLNACEWQNWPRYWLRVSHFQILSDIKAVSRAFQSLHALHASHRTDIRYCRTTIVRFVIKYVLISTSPRRRSLSLFTHSCDVSQRSIHAFMNLTTAKLLRAKCTMWFSTPCETTNVDSE